MWNPTTIVINAFIALVAMSYTFPTHIVSMAIVWVVLGAIAYRVVQHDTTIEHTTVLTDTLRSHVESMVATGYDKNNEDIPLRRIKRFKYIYLESHMVRLLVELFRYEAHYKDVVYSVVYYCEAFVRQVFRMMEGKVKDAHQARTLGERILNHMHTLLYNASKYEKHHIDDMIKRFTVLVWDMFARAVERVNLTDAAYTPSAEDPMARSAFDLQCL